MILRVLRYDLTMTRTMGLLLVDGRFLCYTLEDPLRRIKIPGDTAIPDGDYAAELYSSPRFKQNVVRLANVPNFDDIEIHWGNTAGDTRGCVLVGLSRDRDAVTKSRAAFDRLMPLVRSALVSGQRLSVQVQTVPTLASPLPQSHPASPDPDHA